MNLPALHSPFIKTILIGVFTVLMWCGSASFSFAQSDPILQIPAVRDALRSPDIIPSGPDNFAPVGDTAAEGNAAAAAVGEDAPNTTSAAQESVQRQQAATQRQQEARQGQQTGDGTTYIDPQVAREGISGWIYGVLITIGGMFTWVGGNMLDHAVEILVVDMGKLLSQNIGVAVDSLWQVVRDIFNILFIFGLIWIGLQTIVYSNDSNIKQQLSGIIIAALLINFSLFITKSVVDFTNIAATQIYNAFEVPNSAGTFSGLLSAYDTDQFNVDYNAGKTRRDISAAFMANLRLSSFAGELQADMGAWAIIGFGVLMMLMMMIAGFVFLAGAILLIVRFVVLVILMIFSPAMFLGMIFPQFKKWTTMWWGHFWNNAFVAPAYLFMLYLCLSIFTGLSSTGTFASAYGGVVGVLEGSFAIFLYFGVMVAFLIASIKVATSMSSAGTGAINSVGMYGANMVRRGATGLGMMPVNYGKRLGQNAGALVARNVGVGIPGTSFGVGGRFTKRSYDNLKAARARQAAGTATGADKAALLWHAARGAGSLSDREADLKAGLEAKPFGGKSRQQVLDATKAQDAIGARTKAVTDLKANLSSTDNAKVQQAFSDMTNAQLLEIAKTDDGARLIKDHAEYLSASQFKAIADSDDFNDAKTGSFAAARSKKAQAAFGKPDDLKKANKDQLTAMGVAYLRRPENAVRLTEDKIKGLDIVDAYKEEIKKARKDALVDIVTNGTTVGGFSSDDLAKLKPSEIADLPNEVFGTSPNGQNGNVETFVGKLSFTAITELAKKKNRETQKVILPYLQSIGMQGHQQGVEMRDWLNNDTIGRKFGR